MILNLIFISWKTCDLTKKGNYKILYTTFPFE